MKYKINLIIIVFGLSLFISCNEENNLIYPDKMEVVDGLKSFDSYQELYDEIETVNNLTLEELVDYENVQDYNSFGKISDLLYYNFIEDTTLTLNDILTFIERNPKYVELVIETDTSFVPTYETSLRYIMNDDRIFKVQDTLFKVFTSGILSTLTSNYGKLLLIEDKDLGDLDSNFCFSSYVTSKAGNYRSFVNTVGNERIKIVFGYTVISYQPLTNIVKENFRLESTVRPYHKFSFYWHYAKRTISTNYTFSVLYNGTNFASYLDYVNGTSPSFSRYKRFSYGTHFVSTYLNTVFNSFSGTVSQPNVTITLQ